MPRKIRWNEEDNKTYLETLEDGVLTSEEVSAEDAARITAEEGNY